MRRISTGDMSEVPSMLLVEDALGLSSYCVGGTWQMGLTQLHSADPAGGEASKGVPRNWRVSASEKERAWCAGSG
jgi:hypothetical protein